LLFVSINFHDLFLKNDVSFGLEGVRKEKIIVFEDFEVENGVLGLERDIYLSIVKFLDSSILRKV
jgi:hypothetical protein